MSGSLSPSQRERFNSHGYFTLPDILSDGENRQEGREVTFKPTRPVIRCHCWRGGPGRG
jgi:hypothetical protein